MSTKQEIRLRMGELQKEYSTLAAELKQLDAAEKQGRNLEKFKDYTLKVFAYGYSVQEDAKLLEVTDDDRALGRLGRTGIAFVEDPSDTSGLSSSGYFIMLKSADELPRIKLLFERMNAAERIRDEKETETPKFVKVLLGETE
jgi:hypothetical protein